MKKVFSILSVFVAFAIISSCSEDEDKAPVLSSLNSITEFKINFSGVDAKDVISKLGDNITISVPFKTSLKGLKPTIKVSDKATVLPKSSVAIDFVDGVAKPFVVTAEDGSKKTYKVTITVRGEVGSGSKIKTYKNVAEYISKEFSFFVDNSLTSYEYDSKTNFVTKATIKNDVKKQTTVYTFTYDKKNQITEKKSEKTSLVYTYNDKGQIISSIDKEEGKEKYSNVYTYDDSGNLIKKERTTKKDGKKTVYTYKYNKGNVIEQTVGTEKYTATYDTKNNPFIGMYPKAYGSILVDIHEVNKNNPITLNTTDKELTYTYNKDGYPLTCSYKTTEVPLKVDKTFTYYTE